MSDGDKAQSNILRLRGLPFEASAKEIVEFFESCNVKDGEDGVHLTKDRYGRPSGEAYVEFATAEDTQKAMGFNKKHMGRRYIEVFASNESEMNFVLPRSGTGAAAGREPVLRMRGLPFSADFSAIREFFQGYNIVKDGILMVYNMNGKFSGEAYVQFSSPDVALRAMSKNKQNMGHRYIELFPSSMAEAYSEANRQQGYPHMYQDDYGYEDYEGMPQNYGPPPHMMQQQHMRGGHRMQSGGMGGGRGGRPGPYQAGYHAASAGSRRPPPGQPGCDWPSTTGYWVHMRGLPYSATEDDICEFFAPLTPALVQLHLNASGLASGEADVDFNSEADARNAMGKDKQHIGSRYIDLFLHSVDDYASNGGDIPSLMSGGGRGGFGQGPRGGGRGGARGGYGYEYSGSAQHGFAQGQGGFGRGGFRGRGGGRGGGGASHNGRGGGGGGSGGSGGSGGFSVRLRGLPWAAAEKEIAEFLKPVQASRIELHRDHSGRSAGEASVQLANSQDMQQVLALSGEMMGSRYIEIFTC